MRHLPFFGYAGIVVSLAFISPGYSPNQADGQIAQNRGAFEITGVDLFGIKGWDSRQVSVLGFMLGMERREAFMIAQRDEVHLDDDHGQGCLTAKTCSVIQGGNFNGVNLYFGETDVLEKIGIEVRFRNVSREERSASVADRFNGVTRRFVESYSDNLRIRTLGRTDVIRAGKMPTPPVWANKISTYFPPAPARFEYQYGSLGLILHVDLHDPAMGTDSAIDRLTIEFVRPGTSR